MKRTQLIAGIGFSVSLIGLGLSIYKMNRTHPEVLDGQICEKPGLMHVDCLNGSEEKCSNGTHVFVCGKDKKWYLAQTYPNGTDQIELGIPLLVIPLPDDSDPENEPESIKS